MEPSRPRFAGLDGALAVAVAIGLTELAAGLSASIPSAVAAVGGFVVDLAPPSVEDFAIDVFGTSDKGALAVGTVAVAILVGVVVGRLAVERFWVAWAGFGLFAVLGVAAQVQEPGASPLVLVTTALAALAGVGTLRFLLGVDAAASRLPEPTDGRVTDGSRRSFVFAAASAGVVGAASLAL
ncbi:MAG: hypothetical protein EHM57_04375, partial [Actinobacteria bacterium]